MQLPKQVPLLRGSYIFVLLGLMGSPLGLYAIHLLSPSDIQPPRRVPSNIAWTEATVAEASHGDAVRGLFISSRCARCHGQEGFSANASIPNLAGIDKLAIWKQLVDFRDGKRLSSIMNSVAEELQPRDYADLAAYYSTLPAYPDPGDTRAFPEQPPDSSHPAVAARLVNLGDGSRGIPPCQVCHGPSGYKPGAPSLVNQNSTYISEELEKFAKGDRANDINIPMRSIAGSLSKDEMQALGDYYGSGLGALPASSSGRIR